MIMRNFRVKHNMAGKKLAETGGYKNKRHTWTLGYIGETALHRVVYTSMI